MSPSLLVGRAFQTELLADAIRSAQTGRGTSIHIVGEPGIGKTSLLRFVQVEAVDHVIFTVAEHTDQRRRLGCVSQLFAGVATASDPIGAALETIEELVAAHTCVLLADDVHWADGASLDVFAAIARRAEDLGVVLITTARPFPRSVDLARYEHAVGVFGRRVVLEPLDDDDVADLVVATLGAHPEPALAEVLAGASGNPFLVVELLRALDHDGDVTLVDGALRLTNGTTLPPELGERLGREAIAAAGSSSLLVRLAAVIPGGFTVDELAKIVERSVIHVVADLLDLSDGDVLSEQHGRLRFRHDIIRQAIVDATPASVVRSLNRRAVVVLTESGAEPARIADCLLMAADPQDPDELASLIELGSSLRDSGPLAAVDVLSVVLDALDPTDPRFVEVVLTLGWTLADLGRLADVTGFLDRLGPEGADRLDVRLLRGHSLKLRGELDTKFAPLSDDVDLDAAVAEVDDAAALVAELSVLEILSGRTRKATRLFEWVEHSGAEIGPVAELCMSEAHALLHGRKGSFEAGLEAARRGVALAAQVRGWTNSRSSPVLIEAAMLDAMGRGDEALHALRAAQSRPGPRWSAPLLQMSAGITLYRRGEWDDALAEVTAGLACADEFGVRLGTAWPFAVNVLIHMARGDHAAAEEWLCRAQHEVTDQALGMEWLMYASAMFAETHDNQSTALAMLTPVIDFCLAIGAPAVLMNLSPDTARLAVATGDDDTLHKVTASLKSLAANTTSPVVRAFDLWAGGWQSRDHRAVEQAAGLALECGRVAEYARAHHDAAVLAASAGDAADARRLAGLAFTAYDQMRAEHLHARLRAELRAHDLSMRPRRAPRRPSEGWDSLTASERRVVELVGDGLTNGQVAEQLFVSRRTVESHLGRVYQKLGFPRRAVLVIAARNRRNPGDQERRTEGEAATESPY